MSWINEFVGMLFPIDAGNLRIEPAYTLKQQNLPKSIFKYRGVDDYSLANLRNDKIWLADPKAFNDPYDCSVFFDLDVMAHSLLKNPPDELIQMMGARFSVEQMDTFKVAVTGSESPLDALVDAFAKDLPDNKLSDVKAALAAAMSHVHQNIAARNSEIFKDAFKVCSFSERVDSTLMWSHYADCHKGFCIEYSLDGCTSRDYLTRFLYPIIYSTHPFNATEYFEAIGVGHRNNLHFNKAGLIKSTDWAYEREWRLIFANGILNSAQTYSMPKPKCVYLGSHIQIENQRKILEVCLSKGIPVRKMKHSPGAFVMQATEIENAF
ncbi:DUF2971 domain-containing protein [Burkholderia multivorans]|uniref:DUF2971 domain-containing protein n=1 Tax=Burkholderia multivorans TaxID=87883 RepID=UPI001C224846|nr:DUF2971 domain-containing protein [Burkholderia multivorans]MBU9227925.1 DUF2971 domain-containing protein [Burkholderia multivorans]